MHIETDVLCLLLLCAISYQSLRSVNQQTNRLLFRRTVYGVIAALGLDMLRALIDGRVFSGAVPLNRVLNMLYLDAGILLVCAWHLYVLERLRVSIRRRRIALMMCPAAIFVALNFASLWTEWVFGITDGNLFFRGRLFWIHPALLLGVMFASLVRIHIARATKGSGVDRRQAFKFTSLFLIPIAGTLLSLPFPELSGMWSCATVAIVLLYMNDQEREILRDGLTGLNNRKTLAAAFADYTRRVTSEESIYLFMLDLDDFKRINDTLGHPTGDEALMTAARVLKRSCVGIHAIIARYGGDEFVVMGFFAGEEAVEAFKEKVRSNFEACNAEEGLPYHLAASIGCARYHAPQTLTELMARADEALYVDKQQRHARA